MRPLRASLFMSLDGVVDSPQNWHFAYQDKAMTDIVAAGLESADAILLGRRTYEEWAGYWPHQSGSAMADYFNSVPKHVVSRTLASVHWQGAELVSGDLASAVREIKSRPGKGILTSGSGTLLTSLLQEGLVDELGVMVHPIVVGSGKHLF